MRLSDLNSTSSASKALREHYSVDMDLSRLSHSQAVSMLRRIRDTIQESRIAGIDMRGDKYMRLVFMEQSVASHIKSMRDANSRVRIVVENEEVDKSQVVLAAQDMVDNVQKMIEQVSDMLVKELPALVDSMQSDIGVNEGEQFMNQASEALRALQEALSTSKQGLQGALNVVTGQEQQPLGSEPADMGADAGEDTGEMPDMEPDLGGEEGPDLDALPAPEEEPEEEPTIGRAKRS